MASTMMETFWTTNVAVIEVPWQAPAPPDGAALLAPLLARPRTEPEGATAPTMTAARWSVLVTPRTVCPICGVADCGYFW